MNVPLKISLRQLQTLVTLMNNNKLGLPMNRDDKVSYCNIKKVRLKIKKLWIVWEDSVNLFSSEKKLALTLDYSEAHHFEEFINLLSDQFEAASEEANHLRKIKLFIDQKLA